MAYEKRKKNPTATTPKGVAVYPKLTEPDYGNKEYPKPEGEYSLKLRISQTDADAWVNRKNIDVDGEKLSIQDLYDRAIRLGEKKFSELKIESRKKLKQISPNPLFTVLYDKDTEEPTGEVEFKFKMTASGERKDGPQAGKKWTQAPELFDAFGRKLGKGISIWGGSTLKVSVVLSDYFIPSDAKCGLSLKMKAVQVIDLVSSGSRTANSYGFEEEEGGFAYDPEEFAGDEDSKSEAPASGGATAGEEDF